MRTLSFEAEYPDEGLHQLILDTKEFLSPENVRELLNLRSRIGNKLQHIQDQSNVLIVINIEDYVFQINIGDGRNRVVIDLPEPETVTNDSQALDQYNSFDRSRQIQGGLKLQRTHTMVEQTTHGKTNAQIYMNKITCVVFGGIGVGCVFLALTGNPGTRSMVYGIAGLAALGKAFYDVKTKPTHCERKSVTTTESIEIGECI